MTAAAGCALPWSDRADGFLIEWSRETGLARVWQTVTSGSTDVSWTKSYSVTNTATVPSWLYRLGLP
jgi:hypothetical protein